MVKRLFVFLFIFFIGCSVLTCSQTSNAQTESPKKNAQEEPASNPIRQSKDTAKQGEEKQDSSKSDEVDQNSTKLDVPKQDQPKTVVAPKKASIQEGDKTSEQDAKKGESKQDESKQDESKQDESKQDESKQDESKQDESKKDESKKDESKKDAAKQDSSMKDESAKKDAKPAATKSESATDAPEVSAKKDESADDSKPADRLRSELLLPPSTKLWVSIPDVKKLSEQFDATQFGLLAKDEAIKPFIESFRQQAKDYLTGQNVQFGIDIDDLNDVQTGEICVAGVLPELDGKQPAQAAHGIVLLVDVSKTEVEAKEFLVKINAELIKRGAKQEVLNINEVECKKSTLNNPRRFRPNQSSFQTVVNGWMLVSDNETIFRDVLQRMVTKKTDLADSLSVQTKFIEVMNRTDLGKETAHVRWFVDPFGYLQLAQALQEQDNANRVAHDDWAGKLRNNGFDAFQGIGGNISIATSEHEILHRTFVYAPNDEKSLDTKHVFDLFDFRPVADSPLEPPKWVPANCAGYFTGNWNMSRALEGFGVIYDGLFEEGEFDRMLSDFRVDAQMQLDVRKLIGKMNNRVTVVSAVDRPITEDSERICIGIPIKDEPKFVFDSLKRATRGQVISLGGIDVIKVDSSDRDIEEEDPEIDIFEIEGAEIEEEEEEERQFELFKQRFFVVRDGYLLVANNKDFLRKLMSQKVSKLNECADYIEIKDAIGKLTDGDKVSLRQFGRIDQALETNYEMLRRGEMGKSQTVLARVVNQIFAKNQADKAAAEGTKADPDEIREQKLDGSKLPKDFSKSIAPYFGPTGWVMETEKSGWRITGCVLKKKEMTEVVQKIDNDEKR